MCLRTCRDAALNESNQRADQASPGGFSTVAVARGFRHAGAWLLIVLLLASTGHLTWSAASANKGSSPSDKDSTEYAEPDQFLRTRVSKLLAIIERARNAQRKLQSTLQTHQDSQTRQTYAKWQEIEQQARNMLTEIQQTLKTLDDHARPETLGPMAKNVILTRLDGKREAMANHRGGVVLLHFWATWCRPCVKEMGSLEQLYQDFQGQGFSVLPVSLDARKKDVNRFVRKKALRLPMYFDPSRTVYQEMIGGAEVLPRSLLIDKAGRIARVYAGAHHLQAPEMLADIRRLLAN
jgi:peroxiredoxin